MSHLVLLNLYLEPAIRKMITAAWLWAANTNNLRKSCIHGEEEAKLILTDSFEAADVTSHETSQTGAMDIEETM